MKRAAVFVLGALTACGTSGDADSGESQGDPTTAGTEPAGSSGGDGGVTSDDATGPATTGTDEGTGPSDDDTSDTGNPGNPSGDCAEDSWIGVPEPPFGLHDEPAGPVTHYVDNTAGNCSDADNGTADAPRCSIPTSIPAGALVEVHGGPYPYNVQETAFQLDGTAEQPAFLRGVDNIVIDAGGGANNHWAMSGSYYVVEGFEFVGGATIRLSGDHYGLRHSEVDFGERNCVNAGGSFGVVFDNELHHCHRQPGEQDAHGVQVGLGASNMWVVGNDVHHNFGNGIQWGHGGEANPPDFLYIAGNSFHQDRETGIASKWSGRSVISCNTVYDYRPSSPGVEWCADDDSYCNTPSSGSAGQGIIQGADGFPTEEWVLYNTIYDTAQCLRLEDAARANYVGNVCFDVLNGGLRLEKSGHDTHFLHNTFYNVGIDGGAAGIQQDWRDEFTNMRFENNIFDTTAGHMIWFEDFSVVTPSMAWNNNYLYNGGAFTIEWQGVQTINTLSDLESVMAGQTQSFTGNAVADPGLSDPTGLDFRPVAGSPVIGAGSDAIEALDAEFKATFGNSVTIIQDCWSDGEYDVGAVCGF